MPKQELSEKIDTDRVEYHTNGFNTPEFGEDHPLYTEADLNAMAETERAALQIKNVITGYKAFNFKGPRWHNFRFAIRSGVAVRRAVVSIALLGIYNRNAATHMEYAVQNLSISYSEDRKTIYASGRVYVGDTDGYLRQLSYHCVAI